MEDRTLVVVWDGSHRQDDADLLMVPERERISQKRIGQLKYDTHGRRSAQINRHRPQVTPEEK